jgi:hypothetical protein
VLNKGPDGLRRASDAEDFQRVEEEILAELKRTFSPEFINRVDEVIVFNPLGREELRAIVDILLDDVNDAVAARPARRARRGGQGVAARQAGSTRRPAPARCDRGTQDACPTC